MAGQSGLVRAAVLHDLPRPLRIFRVIKTPRFCQRELTCTAAGRGGAGMRSLSERSTMNARRDQSIEGLACTEGGRTRRQRLGHLLHIREGRRLGHLLDIRVQLSGGREGERADDHRSEAGPRQICRAQPAGDDETQRDRGWRRGENLQRKRGSRSRLGRSGRRREGPVGGGEGVAVAIARAP